MKSLSIRVAQRLLALFLLVSASLAAAQPTPDMAAAREAAAQVIPKLEAGSWQSSWGAYETSTRLAASNVPADRELAEKIVGLCAASLERGLQQLPAQPEQALLLQHADAFADALLRHPTALNLKSAKAVVATWEKALPSHLSVRLLRLRLHVQEKNRGAQIKLSEALMKEEDLGQDDREYVWEAHVSALLRGRPAAADIQRAEAVVTPWLQQQPRHLRARFLLLQIHHARQDWPAQHTLATELLKEKELTGEDRKWVHQRRVEASLKLGRTHELDQQDWDFMLETITGGPRFKKFIQEYGGLLLAIGFAIGWVWLLGVALITRFGRAKPPGFWMVALWGSTILYASTVILAPLAHCIVFSLLGIAFVVFGITGQKAPLEYLVAPQKRDGSGKARWWVVLGWVVLAFLLIQAFTQGYAWAFQQVMGRPLESQLVAKLLHADTLPWLAALVLAGGLFVPLLEEVVFRGVLQDWVGRWLPAGWCVALVSVLFGVVHGLEMAIPIAFIGVLLSLFRLRYRSLWPAVFLHALNNSVMVVALYFSPEFAK